MQSQIVNIELAQLKGVAPECKCKFALAAGKSELARIEIPGRWSAFILEQLHRGIPVHVDSLSIAEP